MTTPVPVPSGVIAQIIGTRNAKLVEEFVDDNQIDAVALNYACEHAGKQEDQDATYGWTFGAGGLLVGGTVGGMSCESNAWIVAWAVAGALTGAVPWFIAYLRSKRVKHILLRKRIAMAKTPEDPEEDYGDGDAESHADEHKN